MYRFVRTCIDIGMGWILCLGSVLYRWLVGAD